MIRPSRILLLALASLVALAAGSAPAPAGTDREAIRRIVVQEALRSERVPPSLALAVAEAESDFDPAAESPAGARGVMQIMPATGRGEFGVEPDALWRPRLNVRLGIAFLDRLIATYGERWDLALSHYNGGSRVGRGAAARVIPATRGYVDKVLRLQRRYARDETVRLMVAAAERTSPVAEEWPASVPAPVPAADRSPDRAIAAAELAAVDRRTADPRPAERRRRLLALAERALAMRAPAEQAPAERPPDGWAPAGSGGLLAGIEAQRRRFRALLEALRDG
ncbi:MAG: lytic transglycosylase domain-containing protein [Thalassobaculum sp.]|uniref:lytic transglycosylase domain-containing protein n=1 Tax=Thalassobaculum sp. TaxID=2022740 RepID=UPI0032EB72EB